MHTFSFSSPFEALKELHPHIMGYGVKVNSRGGVARSIKNVIFDIPFEGVTNNMKKPYPAWRKFNTKYHEHETYWYMNGSNTDLISSDDDYVITDFGIWRNIINQGPIFSNYGWYFRNNLERLTNLFLQDVYTRRAALNIYNAEYAEDYVADHPCTLGVVYYIENNELSITVTMRSCDLIYGFCYDILWWYKSLELLYKAIAAKSQIFKQMIKPGYIIMQVTDLHIYEKHWDMPIRK